MRRLRGLWHCLFLLGIPVAACLLAVEDGVPFLWPVALVGVWWLLVLLAFLDDARQRRTTDDDAGIRR